MPVGVKPDLDFDQAFFVDTKAIGLQSMGFGVVPQIKGKHMHF
jgi:hypothetical protein